MSKLGENWNKRELTLKAGTQGDPVRVVMTIGDCMVDMGHEEATSLSRELYMVARMGASLEKKRDIAQRQHEEELKAEEERKRKGRYSR